MTAAADASVWLFPAERDAAVGASLDTLAQLSHSVLDYTERQARTGTLVKRARAKFFSTCIATALAELRSPLERSYRNAIYCAGELRQEGERLTATYCGTRWCSVCNRIRTARAINRYQPIVETWPDKCHVTLTIRNVTARELEETIGLMLRKFRAVSRIMRRTRKIVLKALRKLECTYNRNRDDYHPHFHVLCETREQGRALIEEWLRMFPDHAEPAAQHITACKAGSMSEFFKYFTKLLAKTQAPGSKRARSSVTDPIALDVIFRAMQGRRVYQPVGFRVAAAETEDENAEQLETSQGTLAPTVAVEPITWEWKQPVADWVAVETGECLTGYEPSPRFRELANNATPAQGALFRPRGLDPGTVRVTARVLGEQLRETMRERIVAIQRQRSAFTPEGVAGTLRRVFGMQNGEALERARELTGADTGHQLSLLPAAVLTAGRHWRKPWWPD